MIGVDTNILLRLFDKTDAAQSARAEALVRAHSSGGCHVNAVVLSEVVWTLVTAYNHTRAHAAERIDLLLEAPEFVIQNADEAARALQRYRKGPADFADYFLAEINRSVGCRTTMTFDGKALKAGDLFSTPPA